MRRFATLVSTVAMVLVSAMAIALPSSTLAQGESSLAGHPLVGTWLIAEVKSPNDPFMVIFMSDGVAIQNDGSGGVAFAVWEATGPSTANATFHTRLEDGDHVENITIRAAFEVSEDGNSLSATFTAQLVDANGEDYGELGPGEVTGKRMVVEPMGTPAGPLYEEATPVS